MSTVPAWFDYEFYMTSKLAQLQNSEPQANWTLPGLVETFGNAGFVGEEGAYTHFVNYGAAEDISPNASFNASEYYAAKAIQLYKATPSTVTDFQIANTKALIKATGLNAWTHYDLYGSGEGINPSNAFDAEAYLTAKAAAMGSGWTAKSVADALTAAGYTALEHYTLFAGKGTGEVPAGATYPVAAEKQVPSDNPGKTVNLTTNIDTLTGTAGDDTFVGTATTTQAKDTINGAQGNDTFLFTGDNAAKGTLVLPGMTNIENLVLRQNDATAVDVSAVSGLKTVTLDRHDLTSNVTLTLAGQSVTVKAPVLEKTGGDKLTLASVSDTAVNLTLDSIAKPATSGTTTVDLSGTKMAALTVTALGTDSAFTLANSGNALKTLTIKGNAKVDMATAVALTTIDASANTAGVTVAATGTAELAFTGTAFDDYLSLGGSLSAKDKLVFGAGNDTLSISNHTLTTDLVTALNAATGLDVLEFKSTDLGNLAVNAHALTVDTFKVASAISGTNDTVGVDFTGLSSNGSETVILAADITAGSKAALHLAPQTNSNADSATITVEDANVTLTSSSAAGLDAASIETLNIMAGKDLKVDGGVVDTLVSTSATVNVSGAGNVDLGTVSNSTGIGDATNNLTINAANLTGKLSVVTGAGNDIIFAGSGGSTITAGKGADTITLGAGKDTLIFVGGDSGTLNSAGKIANYDVVKGFTAGKDGDVLQLGTGTSATKYDALTADQLSEIAKALDLTAAANAALGYADDSNWTAFNYGGKAYALYDTNDSFDATYGVIVELTGVSVSNLVAANFMV